MPLIKREVIPIFLSRQLNTQGAEYELESVTNKTLSNVVLQLSSLSKHAEDIFGELYNEADSICKRSCELQERIDKLSNKVTKLDATKDDVSLLDIETKPFSSKIELESTPLNKKPATLDEAYKLCQPPPPLNKLSEFREDGKEALKFYTDPKYFFELWCQEMQKNIQDIRQKRKKRRRRVVNPTTDAVTAPRSLRDQYSHLKMGVELQPAKSKSMTGIGNTPQAQHHRPDIVHTVNNTEEPIQTNKRQSHHDRNSVRPGSKPPAPPGQGSIGPNHDGYPNGDLRPGRPAPQPPMNNNQGFNEVPSPIINHDAQPKIMTHDDYVEQMNSILPPPPPIEPQYPVPPPAPSPPPMDTNFQPPPPPPPPPGPGIGAIPPPPPPPPPPGVGVVPKPPPIQTGTLPDDGNDLPILAPAPVSPVSKPIQADPRSELLKAIERGINLKKTDIAKEKAFQKEKPDNSVEAILSRRIAVELSDSDTEYDSQDEDWSDED